MERQIPEESEGQTGLTSIHRCIHCAATPDTVNEELDGIEIDSFLDTLAEIARAIARRKEEKEECER